GVARVVGGDNEEMGGADTAEAEARNEVRRNVERAPERAVGHEARNPASVPERYPDSAGLVHREPVGMAFRYADEGPALTGGGVDREDDAPAVVREVERSAGRPDAG